MLVVDLHCEQGHDFEGWFASGDELTRQQHRGLLTCPVCGSHGVTRRPSATRLNVSGSKDPVSAAGTSLARGGAQARAVDDGQPSGEGGPPREADIVRALQAVYLQAVRQVVSQTEDVGERFADEARRIHHGDAPQRGIRGQSTAQERAELREEGIETVALPLPDGWDGTLQ